MDANVPILSRDWNKRKAQYDIVIVGSGYGGAIMAARLAAANLPRKPSICLLERGKEWPLDKFPDTFQGFTDNIRGQVPFRDGTNPLGLYDILNATDITVIKGNGLGGTSLVNANVAIIPENAAFQQAGANWPSSLNAASLAPYYRRAAEVLRPNPLPCDANLMTYPDAAQQLPCDQQPRKRLSLAKRAAELGMATELVDIVVNFKDLPDNGFGVAQPACTRCGDCITGCRVGSKNTLYMNYLPWAWRNGVEIFTQNEVQWLEPAQGGGWVVHGVHRPNNNTSQDFSISAGRVVLSAGSINSTEILLRSGGRGLSLTPHVGTRFSGNGDFFGISYNGADFLQVLGFGKHPASPGAAYPPGPTITTKLQYLAGSPGKHFLFEDVSFPSAFREQAQKLFTWLLGEDFGKDHVQQTERATQDFFQTDPFGPNGALNHTMLYLAMALDNASGEIRLKTRALDTMGEPDIKWSGAGGQQIFADMNAELRQHARALGSKFVENPTWGLLGLKHLVTAHPLGGCPIGQDSSTGAVDEFGRVFAANGALWNGLRVVDGSIIPSALGANPLFTISAMAERIAENLIKELGG